MKYLSTLLVCLLLSVTTFSQECTGEFPLTECDDENPCTIDTCVDGTCVHIPIEPGMACDDGDPNTTNDKYNEECECQGTCDDGNPGTYDLNIDGLCLQIPVPEGMTVCDTTACPVDLDFSNPCSQLFFYVSDGVTYCQRIRFNSQPEDDGSCNVSYCDCGELVVTGFTCEDLDDDPCTEYVCNPETGECEMVPVNCDDFDPLTYDYCHPQLGCRHIPIPEGVTVCQELSCEDEVIENLNGACHIKHEFEDGSCIILVLNGTYDEGDPCVESTTCICGNAVQTFVDCDDNNPCTYDECDPNTGECVHLPYYNGQLSALELPPCYELCGYRVLSPEGNIIEDQLDPVNCIADSIALITGQIFDDLFGDEVICSYVLELHYVGINCDDGDDCTIDFCDPETGQCQHIPIEPGMSCDDGMPCTENDMYDAECNCVGTPKNCDDGNPCTEDFCDPETGNCINAFIDCDDGDPCTIDSCNPETGLCEHTPRWQAILADYQHPFCYILCGYDVYESEVNLVASVGNCDGETIQVEEDFDLLDEFNDEVDCQYTIFFYYELDPTACDDGDPCTIDICNPINGVCTNIPIDCNDNNVFTIDECVNGECTHEFVWELDILGLDDNECFTICTYSISDTDLNFIFGDPYLDCEEDGELVTEIIQVDDENGNPVSLVVDYIRVPVNCDDGDPCTLDECHPLLGCTHTPIIPGMACDDGNPCTENDVYDAECNCAGTPKNCDDGNPCTIDSCDPETGDCVYALIICDDGDACTFDSCDPETGECTHTPWWEIDIANAVHPNCYTLCGYDVYVNEVDLVATSGNCDGPTLQVVQNGNYTDLEGNVLCSYEIFYYYIFDPTFCDDNDPCTIDICDPLVGCLHVTIIPGEPCDDGNENTIGDVWQENCECVGIEIVFGCTDSEACNYQPDANQDDGSCLFPGDLCDDGNQDTTGDMYDEECNCVGMSSCPGDLNGDGVVNASDLLEFLSAFGLTCD